MSKLLRSLFMFLLLCSTGVFAQQVSNSNFEDWSGAAFDGNPQPKGWNASNVEQVGMKFNFAHKETGHNGGYCMMVQDQDVGAMGITATSPGYFALGQPWAYLPSITAINQATAGTSGGISWKYRPDSMSVWIKRTGDRTADEDFYLLYYSWSGQSKGDKYRNKEKSCTNHSETNEESDIRQALNGNECGTTTKANQIAEGCWRERKTYGSWTNIRVPIFYMNDAVPTTMNIIFSASNYPNFRANDGLYPGNSLYVDDIELIYSSKIHTIYVDGKEWKGFDPNSKDVQLYSVSESATAVPTIEAMRGAGSITNARGKTVAFPGRKLSGSEITIAYGDLVSKPTKITVKSEDGKSTTVYQIQFQKAASSNAKLADIKVNGTTVTGFSPTKYNYTVDLPYGTTAAPVVTAEGQEDAQTIAITQATSPTGTAKINVTAANKTTTASYSLEFRVAALADNTLKDIKVNGKSVPGFTPAQTLYKVSLPENTTSMPTVEAVSAYPAGAQTISYTAPAVIDGGQYQISVTTPGNPVAKVYKLNFKLEKSSYTYLQDLKVGGKTVEGFEPTKLTYYISLPMGTTSLPAITWTPGDEFQTIEKTDLGAGVVDGTVTITVTAGNGDESRYRLVFSTEKSSISTLNMIYLDGKPLKNFSPDVTSYNDTLPVGVTNIPTITWDKGDEYQQVALSLPTSLPGKARLTVTAGDGSTTVYQINFAVTKSENATLKSIKVDGVELPGFNPEVFEYWYDLPMGTTTMPEVSYVAGDEFQTITVRNGGINGDYKITVRPQSGNSNTYIIHFAVATSSNNSLSMIYLDGVPLAGFNAETLDYEVNLPEGVSKIPAVTFDKGEAAQRVLSVLENKVQTITVTAQNGSKRIYTITFHVVVSENAFLNMIYLNGDSLDGFVKETLNYTVPLSTPTCPTITVDKAPGQQVTITAPYAAGTATILVQPESGAANTYTITFEAAAPVTVRLADILIDGVSLPEFSATQSHYALNYEKTLPTVQGVAESASQTVNVLWQGNVAWIHVSDAEGNKAAYSVTFNRQMSGNATLQAILLDGTPLATFAPTTLDYNIDLAAGSAYPEVGYQTADASQVVFFGQMAEGQWAITVMAEDATKTTYTVRFTIAQYNDAQLEDLQVAGDTIAFDPNVFAYNLSIAEGVALPDLAITAKPGQTVLQFNASETEQHIIVTSEGGATNTYIITYVRAKNTDALLADILIDGESLAGFDSETFDYTDTIAWRSKVVPNVFPVARNIYQTITTTFSKPNGTTRIHVVAQSGAEADYTIKFPVRQSSNVALADLYLNSEEVEINYKPNVTNYVVEMPYQATECPLVVYEPAEAEQHVDVISRPMGDTTQIIVVAENGDKRTYNILFKREVLKTRNLLTMIRIDETGQELNLKDRTQRIFNVNLPFGSRSMTIEYEKAYDGQTVFIQPGGVKDTTFITVKANNDSIADEVYKLVPVVPTQNPAVLEGITVNGKPLEGFDMNRFSYVVMIDTIPIASPIVVPTAYNNAFATPTIMTNKHWQAVVSKDGITNTYDLWFYYTHDVVPNAEFNSWTTAANNSAPKPTGWNCLADYFSSFSAPASGEHVFGNNDEIVEETISGTNKGVQLNSKKSAGNLISGMYGGALGGILPAFVTLGTINGSLQVAAGSSFSAQSGITFRNTPDIMYVRAKTGDVSGNNRIVYQLSGNGSKELVFSTDANTDFKEYTFDLSPANQSVTAPMQLNIILNSFAKEAVGTLTDFNAADMTVDYIRFTFNNKLSALKVDAINATKSGNAFTATLTDPERIELPVLSFTGEVEDQAQLVTWDSTETIEGEFAIRNATIRNFAENGGTNYTDYTLKVKRPLDTKNVLSNLLLDSVVINGFNPTKTDYTVHMPATRHHFHDLIPVPASSLQTITTSFADSTMTITVTPEYGEAMVYKVKFVTDLSDDTTLATITAEGITYDATQHSYDVYSDYLPLITFAKKSDGQTVRLENGVLTVTAENGAVGIYTITRHDLAYTTNGVITMFEEGGNIITGFGETNYTRQASRPTQAIKFTCEQAQDSVVFVQTKDSMTWRAIGTTAAHTYKWEYPVALSSNTKLRMIRVDGVDYSGFDPAENTYEIPTDTIKQVETVADDGQTLTVAQAPVTGGVAFTINVKAENGDEEAYAVTVKKPLSNVATLSGIMLDSVLIPNFNPDTLSYIVTLPSPAVKKAEPKMPSVTYIAGQAGQTVEEIEPAGLGERIDITVHSEDGDSTKIYDLTVVAAKSACKDLTGIMVNNEAIDQFEAGRHYYSFTVKTSAISVDYTSDDRFQTVTTTIDTIQADHQYNYTLHVYAENGDSTQYEVMVYVENASSDAKLANITLDGKNFVDFERALNPTLNFDPGNNTYHINLPSGTTILPEVSAQLKMDGQSVVIDQKKDTVFLHVTAADHKEQNTYTLIFLVPLSTNANLSMIYLNGDSLANFNPDYYFYQVELPVGVHTLPEVVGQKGDATQTLLPVDMDQKTNRATITVKAEDNSYTNKYVISFHFNKSDADTLAMIYADGDTLSMITAEGDTIRVFEPTTFRYSFELPVGTDAFPDLSWDEADEWQTIQLDTIEQTADMLRREITVIAESGLKNIYTVTYTILKSTIDTLQAIFVNNKKIEPFKADSTEYYFQLSIEQVAELMGQMPTVTWTEGDEYQTVRDTVVPEANADKIKCLPNKSIITVTSQAGNERVYTIHYPIELSSERLLNMIYVGGDSLANFDSERFNYQLQLEETASVPVVTWTKREDIQTVELMTNRDTVRITVTAENSEQAVYTITFDRLKSNVTLLRDIILKDAEGAQLSTGLFAFRPEIPDYNIVLPYDPSGSDELPTIEYVLYDSLQVVTTQNHDLPNGDVMVSIHVVAPNEEDEAEYSLTFHFTRNNDAHLLNIEVKGEPLPDFDSETMEYEFRLPYGSTESAFISVAQVTYELSDSLATDTCYTDEDKTIFIRVLAQDGTTEITYIIRQYVGLDDDCSLASIELDSVAMVNFDPEITFYTYQLLDGQTPPQVTATPHSENADVSIRAVSAGDTCTILCTAMDGSERKYYIHFAVSTIKTDATATSNAVLMKRVPGEPKISIATIRNDVTFFLFGQDGHLLYTAPVPVADPNDVDVYIDAENQEVLNNVSHSSCLEVEINIGQIYFYAFRTSEKVIQSGKFIGLP